MKKLILLTLFFASAAITAQTWTPIADFPSGRHHPVSFSLNGKGYAVTGTINNNIPTTDFYEYDPVADSWTTLTAFPGIARSFAIGTTHNGKAYIGFGASVIQRLNDFWTWDPQTGQWTQLADCPCTGRRHPAMLAQNGKIYVGLGDDDNANLRDWWMYTISTDTWVQIGNLPGAGRHHPFQFIAGGELYAGMGHGGPTIFGDWYKLDTATNAWNSVQDFPGEHRVAGTQFSWNTDGFVLSGDGSDHSFMATGEMWRYTAATDSWTQFPSHPGQSRWAPGSFVIGDEVFFFGGFNRFALLLPLSSYKFDLRAATISLEEEALAQLSVFPNPANDVISWNASDDIKEMQLRNTLGQLVKTIPVTQERLDISSLQPGVYMVEFKSKENKVYTLRLVKQ